MTLEEQIKNRKIWIEALRSGQYQQTSGLLRSDNGFCCLGVACDISGLSEWQENFAPNEDGIPFVYYSYLDAPDVLPKEVLEWLGLKGPQGLLRNHVFNDLAHANDKNLSFEQIADLIESEFLETNGSI